MCNAHWNQIKSKEFYIDVFDYIGVFKIHWCNSIHWYIIGEHFSLTLDRLDDNMKYSFICSFMVLKLLNIENCSKLFYFLSQNQLWLAALWILHHLYFASTILRLLSCVYYIFCVYYFASTKLRLLYILRLTRCV